jgi:hypothetical protein
LPKTYLQNRLLFSYRYGASLCHSKQFRLAVLDLDRYFRLKTRFTPGQGQITPLSVAQGLKDVQDAGGGS